MIPQVQRQKSGESLSGAGGRGTRKGLTAKKPRKPSGNDRNILYLDCVNGYMTAFVKTHEAILFFFFWLRWVFIAACRLSLVVASGGYSLLWCAGLSLWWLLLLQSTGFRRAGFSSCSMRAQ